MQIIAAVSELIGVFEVAKPRIRFSLCALARSSVIALVPMAGCSLVPGQYLGITPKINETDRAYAYDTTGIESVEERADIFSITSTAILEQEKERDAARKKVEALRAESERQNKVGTYDYYVGVQDVLLVTVWNHPEINNPGGSVNAAVSGRVINEDGTFFFPYAGKVNAEGKTVQQIRDELTKRLSRVLVEPQVDVSVLQYRSKRAFILGQVEKPGIIPLTGIPLTVADLITSAGGLKTDADLRRVSLVRPGSAAQTLDLYALYYEGDLSQNMLLRPGDVVTVPENRYNKIFVLGEVGRPQSFALPGGRFSLADAIADAGGFNPLSSNAGQLYVIRNGKSNRPQIWHLDAASPDALVLADGFELEPRDIVYVDPAGVARFSRVLNNILPTAAVARPAIQN
ncbi:polysaccharide biosynthesis/export family protein [Pigmentiphaga sp.]|uniref:polysaccharide biosynthesis/export family protein n=1 Tax=Pigmentiphaga sp. TaxID=1977564 RepID=UPI00128D76BB|nr:polysaccharide biosynthesis/export family protein [Pigmentiphaga sp.]MPS27850.1 hypothetical protein [Alcaligenaceae bacterium SAGV5]MPS50971.1 hypothetical protein [Alcaligenaceae bacterium SAGV3]MPT55788.1 hypothetical protein [Alcaligenaceae bacterium]